MSVINIIKTLLEELQGMDLFDVEEKYEAIRDFLPLESDIFSSQEGEDILIKRLLKKLYAKKGFYVDVGAYDPIRFSNTFHFYLKGWSGINIDPNEETIKKFNSIRPRDVNLNFGIGGEEQELDYFCFAEGAFNTFSRERFEIIKDSNKTEYLGTLKVKINSLKNILDKYLPQDQAITFLNIDVEGFELEVLHSNDWENYRPFFILVEALNIENENDINSLLTENNYLKIAKTKNTMVYAEKSFYEKIEKDEDIEFDEPVLPDENKGKSDSHDLLYQNVFQLQHELEELKLDKKQSVIVQKNLVLENKQKLINEQKKELKLKDKELEENRDVIRQKNQQLENKQKLIHEQKKELNLKDKELEEKRDVIRQKNQLLENKQKILDELNIRLNEKNDQLIEKNQMLAEMQKEIDDINKRQVENEAKLTEMQTLMERKNKEINDIYISKKYRLGKFIASPYLLIRKIGKGGL